MNNPAQPTQGPCKTSARNPVCVTHHTVSHRSPSLCNANTGLWCQDPASCAGGGWEEGGGKELILAPPTPIQPGATWRRGDTCTLHTSLGARWTQIFTTNQRNTVDSNSKILMLAVSCSPGSDRDWTPGCLHSI